MSPKLKHNLTKLKEILRKKYFHDKPNAFVHKTHENIATTREILPQNCQIFSKKLKLFCQKL